MLYRLRSHSAEDWHRKSDDDIVRDRRDPVNSADNYQPRRLHGDRVPLVLQEHRLRCLLLRALLWPDRGQTQKGSGRSGGGGRRYHEDRQPSSCPVQLEAVLHGWVRKRCGWVGYRDRYYIRQRRLHPSVVFTRIFRQYGKTRDIFTARRMLARY